ncbi:peptidoglycan editing factor PgeF [Legionella clemsonensis]|uniref:Purine nucleoside phosphorylase n=1 Tax=Legionella clemsonensis TaxID=1867846 RepID=A0A222P1E7_9GAMM|nr:peptidoglycan editing factor PgeF [Legionella clemsonensis]ASQ45684.1 Laccase domain protein YfiH [Legionella clemsonensis]
MNKFYADWPAPANISAFTTLRSRGFSKPPFDKNNLALHVGDNSIDVILNRQQLRNDCKLINEPVWLDQTHSNLPVLVEEESNREADAAITRMPYQPLAIMTADCLPILLCNLEGNEVAAVHAGWRGLVNGIIENTLHKMQSSPAQLMAWIGPAICQTCFEVGNEVLQIFQNHYPDSAQNFYSQGEKWHANLPRIAEQILNNLGVLAVYQSNICTFEQKNDFYSYRRESQTGRMATLIWFNKKNRNK